MAAMKVDLFEKEKKKLKEEWAMLIKEEKMKGEREKASTEELKTQILNADESIQTTIKMLEKNYGLLSSKPKDSTVWKMRCSLVGDYLSYSEKKLDLVGDFAEEYPDDLFWTSHFSVREKIRSELANKELDCTKKFLSKGTNNYQAWSYREWIIQKIDYSLWKSELQFCHEILDEDKFNVSVWIQICRATRQLNHTMGEESRKNEANYAKKAIIAHPGNEGPWTYLKVLYVEHKETLYKNHDLECIFVDVLAEAADHVKLASKLDPEYNAAYSSIANRGCVHALNLIVDLMINGYEMKQNRRLVSAVNVLFAYPRRRLYSRVPFRSIQHMGILWKVCVAMFSLDACRVRYCHKYRGLHWFRDLSLFNTVYNTKDQDDTQCNLSLVERLGQFETEDEDNTSDDLSLVESFETEDHDDTLCDDGDDWSLVESFGQFETEDHEDTLCDDGDDLSGHLLRDTVLKRLPKWKDFLLQTYFKKQTNNENLEQDLKWVIRRCILKDKGNKADPREELQYTTEIIKVDAYNCRAWLHRQWVLQTFDGDWKDDDEIKLCGDILEKYPCNSYAWDHRYFVVTRLVPKLDAELLQQEVDYAISKFILVEPENPFPWTHILGVYTAYPVSQLVENDKVRNAILQVLVNNDGIKADRDVMVNSGGIINAINMLLDLVVNYKYDIWKDEEFRGIMNELCPDSCFKYEYEYDTLYKIVFVLRRMVKAFPDVDLSWKNNVADQLLTGI